jgi:hypothetical protein
MKAFNLFLLVSLILLVTFSCKDDDNQPVITTTHAVSVSNLAADPTTFDPVTGMPIGSKNQFIFFRFSDSTVVAHADSAAGNWDIGFLGSNIILNSGVSGPGNAMAYIYNGLFSELKQVSEDSTFKTDVSPTELAIGKTWYNYDGAAMILTPKPGKVFVIKTNDNHYVKMEILSYYKNAPSNPIATVDPSRYYTFRYVYQADGSKKF